MLRGKPVISILTQVALSASQVAGEQQHVAVAEWNELRDSAVLPALGEMTAFVEEPHVVPSLQIMRRKQIGRVGCI